MTKRSNGTSLPRTHADEWLGTDELSDLVRRQVAKTEGLTLPVNGDVEWYWSPGVGPVARVKIESVPNVVRLPRRPEQK